MIKSCFAPRIDDETACHCEPAEGGRGNLNTRLASPTYSPTLWFGERDWLRQPSSQTERFANRDCFAIIRIYAYRFLMGYLPSTSFMDPFSNFFLKLLDYESAREILNYTIYPFFPNTFKELDIHFKNLYPCQQ